MKYNVLIINMEDGEVHETIEVSGGERTAERVERGVNINLNHDKFYTEIEEVEEE